MGGGMLGDGDDLVADDAEVADGPVVAAAGGVVADVGVEEPGDVVDLGAAPLSAELACTVMVSPVFGTGIMGSGRGSRRVRAGSG